MAKWVNADVLDAALNNIKTNCNAVAAILAYTAGDSYATVTGGSNVLAQAAVTSADFTGPAGSSSRALTLNSGKQDSAANADGNPTHIAFLDTVNSKVLWVTDETSANVITTGNPVTFPSLVYTSNQPT